jgi:hypothetical protein
VKNLVKSFLPARSVTVEALFVEVAQIRALADQINEVVQQLNHTLQFGGETGLPLMVAVADRCRTDSAAIVATVYAMERSLDTAVNRLGEAADQLTN